MQARSSELVCNNEPLESPILPAYYACGFVESFRRYGMSMNL
jgi:hypothetical protein